MVWHQKSTTILSDVDTASSGLGSARWASVVFAHLPGMRSSGTTTDTSIDAVIAPGIGTVQGTSLVGKAGAEAIEPALSLQELAAQLGVKVQALYDLRSQGRGPTGFRVGRQLRFRRSEIEAWLARLEEEDAERHAGPGR
ncbi:helix-turn-helix transcriptional regulator [Nocardioides humi]|uniref:Helix-turn-helix domain-containing protein n=1 Tax=Nocardioides humi TaxID=449461 RepID=A0ABN2ALG7_9ACTN|nr:helix-turn-helix domain-containing protein [Nocardioides humi]